MSGWPSQPFPPARGHSRSRSPPHRYGGSNSGGGGGPDFGGPGGGWDDRGPYDRRDFRGRSRSPSGFDDARKRRRSPSPLWQRDRGDDRYEPRPRYQDDYDAHSRSRGYSPGRRFPPNNGRNRNMPDPYQMDSPASFKQFAEWFRHTYPRETGEDDIADKIAADAGETKPKGMRVRYERYKKEFHCRQVQTLFDYHRKAPWFQERYDPAPVFENLRKRVRKRGWQGKVHQFLIDLEDGKYDPDLTTAIEPASKPVGDAAPSSEPVSDEKPASPAKDESDVKQEDEPMFDDEGDEGRGGRDRIRVTTGSDEISIPPEGNEVMIRTIAPDIGRIKLEEFLKTVPGFMYLALGEPMQKRNYYRAGWIRFENDADMEKVLAELSERKIDGFKLHVNHTKTPFITRIKNTPEIASRPDRIRADLENVKLLAAKLETEAAELRCWSEPALQPANGNENANGDAPENSNGDVEMSEVKVDPPAPAEDPESEPAEQGINAVERRVAKLVEDLPKPEGEEAAEAFETQKLAIALDLYVAYVRAAYNACFYCAAVVDHTEELHRKCAQHRRRPYVAPTPAPVAPPAASNPPSEAVKPEDEDRERERDPRGLPERLPDRIVDRTDEQFVEKLEARIALLVRPDTVDPKDYGGKNLDEELAKLVEPHIKQEDEGKYRCKTCGKLFKATSFVEKHVANKHGELIKGVDESELFNRFALDPQRIQPYTRIPAPSGSAQPLAPQAFGLQAPAHPPPDFNRGFMQPFNGGGFNNGFGEYPMNGGGGFDRGRQFDYRPQRSPPMGRAGGDRFLGGPGGAGPGRGFDNRGPGGNGFGNGPAMGGRPRRDSDARGNGVPPPPPPDAKEDPRAAAGRKISYHDMDEVAEGDVELTY